MQVVVSPSGKWKEYPVTITAYSYFFGAMFMGLFSLYYAATGQSREFQIPQKVGGTHIIHTHTLSLSLSHTHTHTLSLIHTHTHNIHNTHTHTHNIHNTLTHTHTEYISLLPPHTSTHTGSLCSCLCDLCSLCFLLHHDHLDQPSPLFNRSNSLLASTSKKTRLQ